MSSIDFLEFVVDAGELMLKSGAETFRVEDTMTRMLGSFNFKNTEVFVTTTGIFTSVECHENGLLSMVKRVTSLTVNIEKVADINELSRQLSSKAIDFEQAKVEFKKIEAKEGYAPSIAILASGFTCFGFCFMLGGNFLDSVSSFFVGIIVYIFVLAFNRRLPSFILNILGGIIIGFTSYLFAKFSIAHNIEKVVIGGIMPLIPGLRITNAIRDVLMGDYMSGLSRFTDATLIAVSIAAGVGIVFKIFVI